MRYVASGPFLLDCDMHRPHHRKPVMDSLLAFWPGLQVLWGDIEPAASTHDLLYYVTQKHNFLPEAFNIDMKNLVWANHPLRPEFAESTYFLYKATDDPYYLDIGKSIIGSLEGYARVPCGFAAVKDVRTKHHEDRFVIVTRLSASAGSNGSCSYYLRCLQGGYLSRKVCLCRF